MGLKTVYLELIERIKTNCTNVLTVSIWNNQLNQIDDREQVQFDFPAVFFEMANTKVNQLGCNEQEYECDLIVHIVDKQYNNTDIDLFIDSNVDIFDLSNEVFNALQQFKPTKTNFLIRENEEQDYEFTNLYHLKQTYKLVTMMDKLNTDIEVTADLVLNSDLKIDNLTFRTGTL
jgi:hypothetical protein